MILQDLQKYIESHSSGACLPVDLLKIAKSIGYRHYPPNGPAKPFYAPHNSLFSLVVDAECCLDRLYGGFYSDWVCGGQWNRMLQFLAVLVQTIQNSDIELAVFFNGALEKQRMQKWKQGQLDKRKHINSVLRHISTKGTPPPKVWWVPPVMLASCLRLALRHHGIPVFCSLDDHHREVMQFCRKNNYHGLLAEDSEYIVFDPPRYFSAQQLKLTYKGSLETKEFIADEMAKGLNVPRSHFCFVAALLGGCHLSEDDLREFYAGLVQNYNKHTTEPTEVIEAVVKFVSSQLSCLSPWEPDCAASKIFGNSNSPVVAKFKRALQYYIGGTELGFLRDQHQIAFGPRGFPPNPPNKVVNQDEIGKSLRDFALGLDRDEPPEVSDGPVVRLPPVPHEVMRTANERHQKGLMSPYVYQILAHGELKFPTFLQDENCSEFPDPVLFFRPIRQFVYAILFNHYHLSFMARKSKEDGQGCTDAPDIRIKEWSYSRSNPYGAPVVVEAEPISWGVPTVQRLWFGSVIDDKKRRLRAFLSCVGADSPLMLHTAFVPQNMLIMASVLRFVVSVNEVALLHKQELDAFLVTAFSSRLDDADFLQDLQVPALTSRGCQLASFFMVGVEMAVLANDACGSPIPWLMGCPWLFFDGKLFHSTLHKANKARNLMELCGGNVELVNKVERCRQAIFEGIQPNFIQPFLPLAQRNRPDPHFGPAPHFNVRGRGRGRGNRAAPPPSGSRNASGHMYSRGGQLQVAGVVVGSWGPNFGAGNHKNGHPGYGPRHDMENDYFYDMPRMRNPKPPHNRGRPSVLAKRRQIKPRDPPPGHKRQQQQPRKYAENGYSMQNGDGERSQPPHQGSYPAYNNVGYGPTSFNASANANQPSYASNNHFNAFAHDMMPPAHESMGLPGFQSGPSLHPPMGAHQTLYGSHSNGFKSPDSGVNVSALE